MKKLNSYKTWQAIEKDIKGEGFTEVVPGSFRKYFDNWGICYLTFTYSNNNYSCGINEWGNFSNSEAEDILKYWPYLIKYSLLRLKPKFVRCSTTERQPDELNNGLFDCGFIPTGSVKSNHGNYQILMWEYWAE